jgi:hypothetical protein
MKTPIDKRGFIQINLSSGISPTRRPAGRDPGHPPPEIRPYHFGKTSEYFYDYRGDDSPCDLLMCNIEMGGFIIELCQPWADQLLPGISGQTRKRRPPSGLRGGRTPRRHRGGA